MASFRHLLYYLHEKAKPEPVPKEKTKPERVPKEKAKPEPAEKEKTKPEPAPKKGNFVFIGCF